MAELRIVFITSNGSGLGHLTRSMAAARRFDSGTEAIFVTMSRAVAAVERVGFDAEYIPSASMPGSGAGWRWNLRLRYRLEQLLDGLAPDLVVFDGVHPYRGLTHALTARPWLTSVWCRRPMWRPDADTAALARSRAFTLAIEPGEAAASADRGPRPEHDAEVFRLPPILFCSADELLERGRAATELGLDPARPTAIVALGQGSGLEQAANAAIERLAAIDGLQVATLSSALAPATAHPASVISLRGVYPIAKYLRAFDFGVFAAGYNAFHEVLAARLPALFVPMDRETDDQPARAGWASQHGYAVAASGPLDPSIPELAASLSDAGERAPIERALSGLEIPDGAGRMALELEALARGRSGGANPGGFERWLRLSTHPIGPSLPWAGVVSARELHRDPSLRRPKLGVAGLGLEAAELCAAAAQASADAAVPPERTLVITDARDFGPVAEAGFGIERVPDREQALRLYPDTDYEELLARRLRVALSGRRPSRSIAVAETPAPIRSALGIATDDARYAGAAP